MNVTDLTRDQLVELKQSYLYQLADEGTFAEVLNVDYDEPSQGDLANADEIVPDDVIFEQYAATDFYNDDFSCTAGVPEDFGPLPERFKVIALSTGCDILGESVTAEELGELLPELIAKNGGLTIYEA